MYRTCRYNKCNNICVSMCRSVRMQMTMALAFFNDVSVYVRRCVPIDPPFICIRFAAFIHASWARTSANPPSGPTVVSTISISRAVHMQMSWEFFGAVCSINRQVTDKQTATERMTKKQTKLNESIVKTQSGRYSNKLP